MKIVTWGSKVYACPSWLSTEWTDQNHSCLFLPGQGISLPGNGKPHIFWWLPKELASDLLVSLWLWNLTQPSYLGESETEMDLRDVSQQKPHQHVFHHIVKRWKSELLNSPRGGKNLAGVANYETLLGAAQETGFSLFSLSTHTGLAYLRPLRTVKNKWSVLNKDLRCSQNLYLSWLVGIFCMSQERWLLCLMWKLWHRDSRRMKNQAKMFLTKG